MGLLKERDKDWRKSGGLMIDQNIARKKFGREAEHLVLCSFPALAVASLLFYGKREWTVVSNVTC